MNAQDINKIVDSAFEKELNRVKNELETELYPKAFSDEYAYLRIKNAIEINNKAIRAAIKRSLNEILSDTFSHS